MECVVCLETKASLSQRCCAAGEGTAGCLPPVCGECRDRLAACPYCISQTKTMTRAPPASAAEDPQPPPPPTETIACCLVTSVAGAFISVILTSGIF